MSRYTVDLSSNVDDDLKKIATDLEITKAEVFRRALTLFRHAVKGEKATITTKAGEETSVLVK